VGIPQVSAQRGSPNVTAKQRTSTADSALRLQIASGPAVFCMNHIQQMLLETEVRLVGKLIGIGINSQQVQVQVLDAFLVPGTIEMTPDIDSCGLGGHEQPLFQNLTNSEKWEPRFGLGGRAQKSPLLGFSLEGGRT
jgi:hypothetical protein